ncbi:MAG: LysM peptidoglycan-binding domain-containing protein, partial [Spartobacteria bacterium]
MMFKKNTTAPRRPARRLVPRKTMQVRAASSREEIEEYEGESEPSMKLSQAFILVLVLHVVAVAGIYGFNQLKEKPARPATAKTEAAPAAAPVAESEKKAEPVAKTEPAKTQETQTTYTVVAGDTLKRIASKFKTSIESLEKANNLTSTSILKVGQTLVVGSAAKSQAAQAQPAEPAAKAVPTPAVVAKAPPVKAPAAQEKAEAKPAENPKASEEKSHVVAKGDNPYSLAKKYNITQAALMKANNIDDP